MLVYPQLTNAMIAQRGYQPIAAFKTTVQDTDAGLRTAWSWYGGALAGFPTGPLYNWKLGYSITDAERITLEAFFASALGKFSQFTYLDPAGNLCQISEDFTNSAAWALTGVTVTSTGQADPFGGTSACVLTSSAANGGIVTPVLPATAAALGVVLCGSVYAKVSTAMNLFLALSNGSSPLASATVALPANIWRRISVSGHLTSASQIEFQIGGDSTWSSGTAISLFGAQCAPSWGPGGYAKTPGDYGYHPNVRFDMDAIKWTRSDYNVNSATVMLREFST
jgi:hypothetical protein